VAEITPVGTHLGFTVRDHLLVPALFAALIAKIRRHQQHQYSFLGRLLDQPVSMREIRLVRSAVIARHGERRHVVVIVGRIAAEVGFDQTDQNGVEASLSSILEIELGIRLRNLTNKQPRGVPMQRERITRRVYQIALARLHTKRERRRCGHRLSCRSRLSGLIACCVAVAPSGGRTWSGRITLTSAGEKPQGDPKTEESNDRYQKDSSQSEDMDPLSLKNGAIACSRWTRISRSLVLASVNAPDTAFHPLIKTFDEEMIALSDTGIYAKREHPIVSERTRPIGPN
jgi:hypothetical protein